MGILKTFVSDEPLTLDDVADEIEKGEEVTSTEPEAASDEEYTVDLPTWDDSIGDEVDTLLAEISDDEEAYNEEVHHEATTDRSDVHGRGSHESASPVTDGEGVTRGGPDEVSDSRSDAPVHSAEEASGAADSGGNVSGTGDETVPVARDTTDDAADMDTKADGEGDTGSSEPVSYEFIPPAIDQDMLSDVTSLRHYAVLVTLRTSRWSAKVKDQKAVNDVLQANAAKGNIGTFDKNLLAGADGPLKRIHSSIEAARAIYYRRTLPWTMQDMNAPGRRQGSRILPNKSFFDFAKVIGKYKREVQEALDAFVPQYPKLREQARQNLGSLYNPADYPPPEQIRKHFSLEFDFAPIPEGEDFAGLPSEALEKLSNKLNDSVRTMMQNAMDEAWTRLHECVRKIHERLSDPDKTFHKTLITNAKDTCENLKHLNVAHDTRMEDIRQKVERKLTQTDADAIRENPVIRQRIADDAASILREMEDIA